MRREETSYGTKFRRTPASGFENMDVRGLEPLTPCLQSRLRKTPNALSGVAYSTNQRNSRSSNVPKLYRERL